MKISVKPKAGAGLDLSPMLDVIFQLVLFFLVSTTFATLPGIQVNLPQSSTAQGTELSGITITVQADGRLWFNEQEATLQSLDSLLSEFDIGELAKETYPVVLSADEQITSGVIVGIFDSLRKNGFGAVSLRTASPK